MNLTKSLKTGALAVVVLVATAGASMAATYAWVDQDANVRANHKVIAPVVNHVSEGEKVKIIGSWGNWYKIKVPGPDGWVKKSVLDFSPDYGYGWGGGYGGSFCVNGDHAQFCISGGY